MSSICFHRDLFPGNCFKRREYGSEKQATHIYTLEPASESSTGEVIVKNQDAFNVTQWLEQGVFKALEDQYLEQLTFAIFSSHPVTGEDQLIETYDFKCTYPGLSADGKVTKPKMNNQCLDKQALKTQANKFVRSLIEFSSTLEDVPEDRWITLELAYTPNTPPDYQPEYFKDNTGHSLGFAEGANLLKIRVGNIKTDHHHLDVRFKGHEHLDKESLSIFEDGALLGSNGTGASRCNNFRLHPPGQADNSQDSLNEVDGHGRARSRSSSAFAARAPALATGTGTGHSSHKEPSQSLSDMVVDRTGPTSSAKREEMVHAELQQEVQATTPPSAHISSARVRAYILKQNKSVMKDVSEGLGMPAEEVKAAFLTLNESGFLRRRGKIYAIHNRMAGQTQKAVPPAPRKTPSVRSSPTGSSSSGGSGGGDSATASGPVVSHSRSRLPAMQRIPAEESTMATSAPPPTPVLLEDEKDDEELDFSYLTATRTRSHAGKGKGKGQGQGQQKTTPMLKEDDTMDVDDLSSYEAEWDSQDPYARLVSEPHESDDEPSKEAAKGKAKPDAARSSTTSGTTTTRDSSALQPPSALLQRKKKKADSAPESGPGTDPNPEVRADIPSLLSRPSPLDMSSSATAKGFAKEHETPYRHKRSRGEATPGSEDAGATQPQSKRARKTSIIASPLVLRSGDLSQQSQAVNGSQLECYGYTHSQPRSQ